jgi:hypothetical protein
MAQCDRIVVNSYHNNGQATGRGYSRSQRKLDPRGNNDISITRDQRLCFIRVTIDLPSEINEVQDEGLPSVWPSSRILCSKAIQKEAVRGLAADTTPIRNVCGAV